MTGPHAAILPCGTRMHLQHGPIDLIIGVDQNRRAAFDAAAQRFETVLRELAAELPLLKARVTPQAIAPTGEISEKMHKACLLFCGQEFVTSMAAVAGAVADNVLNAMRNAAYFEKAYVNNGGDIALYLDGTQKFITAISAHTGTELGRIALGADDGISGIATSGRFGRSFSFGIADSVTVLAQSAAEADVAATLIANGVNLPQHPGIKRQPANLLAPDSDLGARPVVTDCPALSRAEQEKAVAAGVQKAQEFLRRGLIKGAAIFLQETSHIIGQNHLIATQRTKRYA